MISQSFASAEDAFGSTSSLENLRYAFKAAAANGVTVLGSSGDGGTANAKKSPVEPGRDALHVPDGRMAGLGSARHRRRRHVSVHRPDRDAANQPRTTVPARRNRGKCSSTSLQHVVAPRSPGRSRAAASATCSRGPSYQAALPAGSTPIPASARGVPDIAFQASAAPARSSTCRSRRTARADCNVGPAAPAGTTSAARRSAAPVGRAGRDRRPDQQGEVRPAGLRTDQSGALQARREPGQYAPTSSTSPRRVTRRIRTTTRAIRVFLGYTATNGWDPVTGLGTPNAALLIPDLVDAAHS